MKLNELYQTDNLKDHIRATVLKNGPVWFSNARRNAPYIKRDILNLEKEELLKPRNRAILCASGASLHDHVDFLHEASLDTDTHIYASPTNWSFLRAHNIYPNFLVSVDGSPTQAQVLGEEQISGATALLVCPYTSHELVKLHGGPNIYWFHNRVNGKGDAADERLHDELGINRVSAWLFPEIRTSIIQAGNVSNTMLILAYTFFQQRVFSYEEVLLAGWDLARGRVSRFESTADGWEVIEKPKINLDHVVPPLKLTMPDGSEVDTDAVSIHYANSFWYLYGRGLYPLNIRTLSKGGLLYGLPHIDDDPVVGMKERQEIADDWRACVMGQLQEIEA